MSLTDSKWLSRLAKTPPDVLLSVGAAAGAVWYLKLYESSVLGSVFAFIAIAFLLLGGSRLARAILQSKMGWVEIVLDRPFNKLREEQREFLKGVFNNGSRLFTIPSCTASKRWFEELEIWNYVDHKAGPSERDSQPYEVTEIGWEELERKLTSDTTHWGSFVSAAIGRLCPRARVPPKTGSD